MRRTPQSIIPSVDAAIAAGVPVIAYDRLIESPDVLYTSFDNVVVGEMEAQAVLDVVSEGNFVIIKGNGSDANSDFLRQGYVNKGIPPVDGTDPAGKIVIVGETYTDNWTPDLAQTEMEQFLILLVVLGPRDRLDEAVGGLSARSGLTQPSNALLHAS